MKIIVYGSTNKECYQSKKQQDDCEKLGKYLGENGVQVLTGACYGYPYYVGKAVIKHGGHVTGYSPAINIEEHKSLYKFPTDGVSELVFNKVKYPTESESFLRRQVEQVSFSDVAIALGGSWGTFCELILSFFAKHTIILVEEFEGAVKAFTDVHEFFGKRDVNPQVHHGGKIIRVKTVDEAIKEMAKLNT